MNQDLSEIPQLGLFHLSLPQAGLLVAKCLWFGGQLEIDFPQGRQVSFFDAELDAALASQAERFSRTLSRAVKSGKLPAPMIKYDIEEAIQPNCTFVEVFTLATWLEERGIYLGTKFEDEYLALERELTERIGGLIEFERHRFALRTGSNMGELNRDAEALFFRHESVKRDEELKQLRDSLRIQSPVSEKQKSAYLNIIGGLLGLLLGKSPSGRPYSMFENQQAIIDSIQANFGDAPGLSTRNLQDKFARAKSHLGSFKS